MKTEEKEVKDVYILAIESSCDETAAAVVKNGREVLSNVISSQIALHTLYGGVVPEIASRKHIEKINQVIEAALSEAGMTLDEMTAIGVTYGPGLVGALLVGVSAAKAIAYAKKLPLTGGKVASVAGDERVVTIGQAGYKGMRMSCFCGGDNFLVARAYFSVRNVFLNGAGRKPRILQNHAVARTQILALHSSYVRAVDRDFA